MTIYSLHRGLAILGGALLCAVTTSALAATITVTNTADSGSGTLRAALASASSGDTIDTTGLSGTILLTSGELSVSNSVDVLWNERDSDKRRVSKGSVVFGDGRIYYRTEVGARLL